MTNIVLTPITSGYQLSKFNDNFDTIETAINEEVLHTTGGNNTMQQDLDLNGFDLLNVNIDPSDPGSLLTVEAADLRYYNITGDTLEGNLDAGGHFLTGLPEAVGPTDAVRKEELDEEIDARIAGDASLQDQLNGTNPPMGSAFSIVSWHDQVITNSITIPDNKNAWSFGPIITIDVGQAVTIGAGSFWTVANGEVSP
ncbi:hypothetical protein D3C85_1123770 [compost metagenome]